MATYNKFDKFTGLYLGSLGSGWAAYFIREDLKAIDNAIRAGQKRG